MSEELNIGDWFVEDGMGEVHEVTDDGHVFVDECQVADKYNALRRKLEETKRSCMCDWDGLNKAAQYLIEHPEYDMLQADATTTDGSQLEMTVVILRGNQNVVEPLRKAKQQLAAANAEVERLKKELMLTSGRLTAASTDMVLGGDELMFVEKVVSISRGIEQALAAEEASQQGEE